MYSVIPQLFQYLDLGWHLCPCSSKDKSPSLISKQGDNPAGWYAASSDTAKWLDWEKAYPGCLWGVRPIGFAVLDADKKHGGDKLLEELEKQWGKLPETPCVATGGGGRHYYFKISPNFHCGGKRIRDCEGLELISKSKGVIIPPSVHPDTKEAYKWIIHPKDKPMASLPDWILAETYNGLMPAYAEAFDPPPHRQQPEAVEYDHFNFFDQLRFGIITGFDGLKEVPHGQRNDILPKTIIQEKLAGTSQAECEARAFKWRSAFAPDYPERELRAKIRSLYQNDKFQPKTKDTLLPSTASDKAHEGQNSVKEERGCHADAHYGIFGEMLRAMRGNTEADEMGVLFGWLTCFGNIVGRGAWFKVQAEDHFPALFVAQVGASSAGKNVAWGVAHYPFAQVEPQWAKACVEHGIGSGEGLVERIADATLSLDATGKVLGREGATDKRCLIRLSELSRCFKVQRRENSSLSESLRQAWDGTPISIPNRKENSLRASDYAVSVFGDITPEKLRSLLKGGSESEDGWMNRFLWLEVSGGPSLPSGGSTKPLEAFTGRLREILAFAKSAGELTRSADAERLWNSEYDSLRYSGDSVPHTQRARAQVVRLAMLYALADQSRVIEVAHLKAGLALSNYCRESARRLFQATSPEPEPLDLKLLKMIQAKPGITRSEIREELGTKIRASEIDDALAKLKGFAHCREIGTGGRKAQAWYPGNSDTTPLLHTETDTAKEASEDFIVLGFSEAEPVKPARAEVAIEEIQTGTKDGSVSLNPADDEPAEAKLVKAEVRKENDEKMSEAEIAEWEAKLRAL